MLLNSLFQRALARAFHTRRSVWLALCAFLLCFSPLNAAHAASISVQVSAGNGDAEERVSDGNMYRTSSGLELVNDGATQQIIGMRFRNLTIPQGATITSAEIQFTVDETDSGVTSVVIKGKGVDDAAGSADADLNAVMA